MKTFIRYIVSCCLLALVFPTVFQAQTIAITTVSANNFCAGDPISVSFTTTGSWGHKNAFTLQLSDTSGSFSKGFMNLASLFDTTGGSLTISSVLPADLMGSSHYRVRVIGAAPFVASRDNGSDLFLGNAAFTLDYRNSLVPCIDSRDSGQVCSGHGGHLLARTW